MGKLTGVGGNSDEIMATSSLSILIPCNAYRSQIWKCSSQTSYLNGNHVISINQPITIIDGTEYNSV